MRSAVHKAVPSGALNSPNIRTKEVTCSSTWCSTPRESASNADILALFGQIQGIDNLSLLAVI
jgi:hypothetical protein